MACFREQIVVHCSPRPLATFQTSAAVRIAAGSRNPTSALRGAAAGRSAATALAAHRQRRKRSSCGVYWLFLSQTNDCRRKLKRRASVGGQSDVVRMLKSPVFICAEAFARSQHLGLILRSQNRNSRPAWAISPLGNSPSVVSTDGTCCRSSSSRRHGVLPDETQIFRRIGVCCWDEDKNASDLIRSGRGSQQRVMKHQWRIEPVRRKGGKSSASSAFKSWQGVTSAIDTPWQTSPPRVLTSHSFSVRGGGRTPAARAMLQDGDLTSVSVEAQVEPNIPCGVCNGRGWLVCDFCEGQKTNVQARTNRIYRRCPTCRAVGVVICPRCKVFKCVSFQDENDETNSES